MPRRTVLSTTEREGYLQPFADVNKRTSRLVANLPLFREIKQTIRDVVLQPDHDALSVIRQAVMARVQEADRDNVQGLIVEELRRLHEGVLARYGLRPSELAAWKASQLAAPPN